MKMAITQLTVAAVMFQSAFASAGQEGVRPDIKALMNSKQYAAAGIDQLTEAQRAALSAWLYEYVEKTSLTLAAEPEVEVLSAQVPAVVNPEPIAKVLDKNWGFSNPPQQKEEAPEFLYANVEGNFRGWTGKTVFRLDNGQVWRQRRSGRFNYRGDARRVVIGKNSWGFFEMRLIEADRSVGVVRVK